MNIAILGLGTIGSGVYELLKGNKEITVKKILDVRTWMDNMTMDIHDIVSDTSITAVVETMGGLHPAREYALACLQAGKSYVSANKLLISECAFELKEAADKSGAALLFSAACGGGIPFLYNLKKTKVTDRIVELGGILNGTSNYILDKIFTGGSSYEDALREAQALGYAERDPSSDVEGYDTLRKLILSCGVAFDQLPEKETIPCYGISKMNATDIAFSRSRDAVIKLVASGSVNEKGELSAYVMPKLVRSGESLGSIPLNINYACYKGERIGEFGYSGQGAGKFPTANNVIRDLYAILQGEKGLFPDKLVSVKTVNDRTKTFYIRTKDINASLEKICAEEKTCDGWYTIVTKKITFEELQKALTDYSDYFAMLMED